MSLMRMAALAAERETQAQPVVEESAKKAAAKPKKGGKVSEAVDRVASFIPSEVIGIYVAGLGIFEPKELHRRWLVFGIAAVLIPFFVSVGFGARPGHSTVSRQRRWRTGSILTVMGLCAFAVWAAAMPETPFSAFSADAPKFGGLGAVVLSAVLPKLATWLKVA